MKNEQVWRLEASCTKGREGQALEGTKQRKEREKRGTEGRGEEEKKGRKRVKLAQGSDGKKEGFRVTSKEKKERKEERKK